MSAQNVDFETIEKGTLVVGWLLLDRGCRPSYVLFVLRIR